MAAPKVFSLAPPTEATEIPAKRESGVNHGPNLFLQADPANGFPEGWFMKSYTTGKWFDVPGVTGDFAVKKIKSGPNQGKEVEQPTGDVAEVTRQLREAANTLGLGVSIKYFPMVYKSGPKKDQEIPGKWVVKYLAQNRKQRREKPAEGAPVAG